MNYVSAIKSFLLENLVKGREDIDPDEHLFEKGLIDSFGLLELVFFIDKELGIRVEDYEIIDNDANSINRIVELIKSKE